MKIFSAALVFLLSFNTQAGISDLFKSPGELCTQEVVRVYGNNKELIRGCQKHESKLANECLDIIIRSNSQMNPTTPLICSYVNNHFATQIMEEFSFKYKLKVNVQILLSLVDTRRESECIENMLYADNLKASDIQLCLDESYEEVSQRGRDTIGHSTATGDITDKARDFFGNLFN